MSRNNALGIRLDYLGGIFEDEYLQEKISELNRIDIEFIGYDKSMVPMASFDDLKSVILMAINNEIVWGYINGILSCGIYDVLKKVVIDIWKKLNGKTYNKIYPSGKVEEKNATFGISMNVNEKCNIDFKLSGDIPDELKEKCLDKAFELIKDLNEKEFKNNFYSNYAKYDIQKQEWVLVDIKQEIEKLMIKDK